MFCSITCKSEFYQKSDNMSFINNPVMAQMPEFVYFFGGQTKLKDMLNDIKRSDQRGKKTIFNYDWSNPNHPNRKKNLLKCCLFLNTPKNYLSGSVEDLATLKILSFEFGYSHDTLILYLNAIPLFAGLLNHSCSGNAVMIAVDNKVATYLIRPVKKDEEIFLVNE